MFGQSQAGRADQHIVFEHQPQIFECGLVTEFRVIASLNPLPLAKGRRDQTNCIEHVERHCALRPCRPPRHIQGGNACLIGSVQLNGIDNPLARSEFDSLSRWITVPEMTAAPNGTHHDQG